MRPLSVVLRASALASLVSCGGKAAPAAVPAPAASSSATPALAASAEPADDAVPSLRSGDLVAIDHRDAVPARITAHHVDDKLELLAVDLVLPIDGAFSFAVRAESVVSIEDGEHGPYAFAAMPDDVTTVERRGMTATTLWIRRPRDRVGQPIQGTIFTPSIHNEPGHRVPFRAAGATLPDDPKLGVRWGRAFAAHLKELGSGPWHRFAAQRIEQVFTNGKTAPGSARSRRPGRPELLALMDTTTGMLSIQETLQQDRPLLLQAAREKPSVPVSKLAVVRSAPHPWDGMLQGIGGAAPKEALADAIPGEFWYFRFRDLGVFFRLADQLDAWGTPAADAVDRQLEERDLMPRYEAELGIARTELSRTFGKDVIDELAVTGSDPYLREGSDVTLILRVKQRPVLEAVLTGTLAAHARAHGGVVASTASYEGIEIHVARSADGAIKQHRATAGDLEILSNSPTAIRRVLDAVNGKRSRLSDEKDFRYMLARDVGTRADALGFIGDRFVAEVVGPRQKVLEARRQIAAAELMTPGFAALLYGWVYGKSPPSLEDLLATRLLGKEELRHAGGGAIAWRPGDPPRSSWGSPRALTPLIDLPPPESVTESERIAYERFARTYETYWSRYIDPALVRLAWDDKGEILTGDLRVLPLIDGTDYREIMDFAGTARVHAPPLSAGLRAVIGIGPNAGLRRELASMSRGFSRHHDLKLDFLGDWAMVGVGDRAAVATAVRAIDSDLPELPGPEGQRSTEDTVATLARVPAYAAIGIRSMAGAAITLAALRKTAEDALPGMLSWGEAGREQGVPIVRIGFADPGGPSSSGAGSAKDATIFYALTQSALLVSLEERALRGLVGDLLEGRIPGPRAPGSASRDGSQLPAGTSRDGSQLVLDLAGERQGALFTVLGWFLSRQIEESSNPSRAHAEALLRGAPERANEAASVHALGLSYFGSAPVPPHGGAYALDIDGVRDPARGTASSPRWPALPVSGSPVDRLLSAVGRFRSEIAFDQEGWPRPSGGMQSLHVRLALGLRGR